MKFKQQEVTSIFANMSTVKALTNELKAAEDKLKAKGVRYIRLEHQEGVFGARVFLKGRIK